MPKLTKSEWFIFLLNIFVAIFILVAVLWAITTNSKPCWNNTASEEQNLTKCEEHSK